MADPNDESGSPVRAGAARVRVNGRRIDIDVSEGRILKGPPALVGKLLCPEQIADLLEAGDYTGRLCAVDDLDDLRLAEAEYRFLRPKEREVQTPLTKNLIVEYGSHGRFRVKDWEGGGVQSVVLEAADGKLLTIPMHRYLNETSVSAGPLTRLDNHPEPVHKHDPYATIEGEGKVELNEADIDRALLDRFNVLFESDAFVARLAEKVATRLATTFADEGQESPGDAIAHSGDDNGDAPT